jgi:hypothetical protein
MEPCEFPLRLVSKCHEGFECGFQSVLALRSDRFRFVKPSLPCGKTPGKLWGEREDFAVKAFIHGNVQGGFDFQVKEFHFFGELKIQERVSGGSVVFSVCGLNPFVAVVAVEGRVFPVYVGGHREKPIATGCAFDAADFALDAIRAKTPAVIGHEKFRVAARPCEGISRYVGCDLKDFQSHRVRVIHEMDSVQVMGSGDFPYLRIP